MNKTLFLIFTNILNLANISQISSLIDAEQRLANNNVRRLITRKTILRWCKCYIIVTVFASTLNVIVRLLTTLDVMKAPTNMSLFGNNFFSNIDILLSYFVLSPIFSLAAFLTIICNSIRIQLKQIGTDMMLMADCSGPVQIEIVQQYHQRYNNNYCQLSLKYFLDIKNYSKQKNYSARHFHRRYLHLLHLLYQLHVSSCMPDCIRSRIIIPNYLFTFSIQHCCF